jgi:hypothetical protein
MDNGILTAILAFAGTIIGSLSGVLASARLTNFRLQQLEKKVEQHNKLVERVATIEQQSKDNAQRLDAIEKVL